MAKDLTAILIPLLQLDDEAARRVVLEWAGTRDLFVRVQPLPQVAMRQIEVLGADDGLPCEDPELVGRLSLGGRAAFVHVNHSAKQAILQLFEDGRADPGLVGEPSDAFSAQLAQKLGATLDAITAADDGSRLGIGVTASNTRARARGRTLTVPPGTPTDTRSF